MGFGDAQMGLWGVGWARKFVERGVGFGNTQKGLWSVCDGQESLWCAEWGLMRHKWVYGSYVIASISMRQGCDQSSLVLEVSSLLRLDSRSLRAPWAEAWLLRMLVVAWAMVSIAL